MLSFSKIAWNAKKHAKRTVIEKATRKVYWETDKQLNVHNSTSTNLYNSALEFEITSIGWNDNPK